MSRKKLCAIFLILILLCPLVDGCNLGNPNTQLQKSGFYFDTVITITLYGSSHEALLEDCFALAAKYESYFSNTIPDSDISQINAAAGKAVTVHDETIELLEKSIYYSELSDGIFDVTIGKLSDLWNISTKALLNETDASMIPAKSEIDKALATVDYRNIVIDGNNVSLRNPDARIDLGGIAKGYIADKMKAYLTEHHVTSGHINLGGNVLCIGEKLDGSPYNIGLQKPFAGDGSSIAAVKIADQTVVSSGVYERYFKVGDALYHHLLDTSTGYPIDNDLLGVSIITTASVDGDALSTICFALGIEKGLALIESLPDTEAIFIDADYVLHESSGIGEDVLLTVF